MEGSSMSSSTNAESSSVDSGILTVMLTEYKSLRDEQLKRADHRITLLTTSITVSGALLATGLQLKSAYVLLTLPLVSSLFGLLIIFHHRAIRDIGLYIRWDDPASTAIVHARPEDVPADVAPPRFFSDLIQHVLTVSPVAHHVRVRSLLERRAIPVAEADTDGGGIVVP
jgi:hypothetical protein